jgi:hypothetical protein
MGSAAPDLPFDREVQRDKASESHSRSEESVRHFCGMLDRCHD